jgi:hypothetical protein
MKVKDLDETTHILIEHRDMEELIKGAEDDGVDTELLWAIYKWLKKNNKLTSKNK